MKLSCGRVAFAARTCALLARLPARYVSRASYRIRYLHYFLDGCIRRSMGSRESAVATTRYVDYIV